MKTPELEEAITLVLQELYDRLPENSSQGFMADDETSDAMERLATFVGMELRTTREKGESLGE